MHNFSPIGRSVWPGPGGGFESPLPSYNWKMSVLWPSLGFTSIRFDLQMQGSFSLIEFAYQAGKWGDMLVIFRCVLASLYEVMSVGRSVCRSVGPSVGW